MKINENVAARKFGNQVRAARKRLQLSQSGLAEAANISTVTVNRIEKGKHLPQKNNMIKIMDVLGIK